MSEDEASRAVWAKCKECDHIWAAAYYPMELSKFAQIMRDHSGCPKCGGEGVLAKQQDGILLEGQSDGT